MNLLQEHCVLLTRAFSPAPNVFTLRELTCQGWLNARWTKPPPSTPHACRNRHGHYVHRWPLFCFIVGDVGVSSCPFPVLLHRALSSAFHPACLLLSLLCLEAGCTGQVQLTGSRFYQPCSRHVQSSLQHNWSSVASRKSQAGRAAVWSLGRETELSQGPWT